MGFVLCQACNRWLFGEDRIKRHIDPEDRDYCTKRGKPEDIIRGIELFTDFSHDVVTIDCDVPECIDIEPPHDFYTTLLHALWQGTQVTLDLEYDELYGFTMPNPKKPGQSLVVIFESSEGGTGAVESLIHENTAREIFTKTLEILAR